MKQRKEFLGLDGFYWWFGVVENRKDPKGLGRCQVRVYGAHTDSLSDIPSADLPWAHPIHSVNNQMFSTPKEGDHVFGFFLDGKFAQQPVMMGIMPTIPNEIPTNSYGFNDVRTEDDIANSPKKPVAINYGSLDGAGAKTVEQEDGFGILRNPYDSLSPNGSYPTNSDLARNERIGKSFIQNRRNSVITDVQGAFGTSWNEPFPAYAAKYPFNKVMETESGHIQEFDDTPKNERIHTAHRSGTFEEIYPSGTKVEKIVKNNYKLILADDHLYVAGKVNITVDSNANIRVEGDVNLEGRGDLTAGIAGDVNFTCGGDFRLKAKSFYVETEFDSNIKSGGALRLGTEAGLHLSTQKLNLMSDNDLSIIADGVLSLTGAQVKVYSTLGVGIYPTTSFDVISPLANFTGMLNALGSSMVAFGVDSHGDSHVLQIGMGVPVPSVLPDTGLFTSLFISPPNSAFLGDAPTLGDPTRAPKFIEPTPADNAGYFFDSGDDPAEVRKHIQTQIDEGLYKQEDLDQGKVKADSAIAAANDETTKQKAAEQGIVLKDPNPKPEDNKSVRLPVISECGGIEKLPESDFVDSLMISKYFNLGQLTGKAPAGGVRLKAQRGLTKGQIVCNLKLLAVNCLDPIKAKYPAMIVTNAFRYPEGSTAGTSQHEIGQAADIQIPNISKENYMDLALWIKDNIPYDQLILEYKTTGTKLPWIHLSFNKAGNRPATAANKVMTMMDHGVNAKYNYLINLETNYKAVTSIPKVTESVSVNALTGREEVVRTTEAADQIITEKTSVDPQNLQVTIETKIEAIDAETGGKIETIKTQVKNDAGEIISEVESFKKQISADPRNGPGGILAAKIDEIQIGGSGSNNSGLVASFVKGLTDPFLKQLEKEATFVGNLADKVEKIVYQINKASCEFDHDMRALPGKIKREWRRVKDDVKKFLNENEKIQNQSLTLAGAFAKVVKKLSQKAHDEIEKVRVALLKKANQAVEELANKVLGELSALNDILGKVYERLYGIYYKLVIERAEKNKKLVDDIKTKSDTSC